MARSGYSFVANCTDMTEMITKMLKKNIIMGRFHKNLKVTSKKNFIFSGYLRDNVVCQRVRKEDMGAWEARRASEEGRRGTRLSSFLRRARSGA